MDSKKFIYVVLDGDSFSHMDLYIGDRKPATFKSVNDAEEWVKR